MTNPRSRRVLATIDSTNAHRLLGWLVSQSCSIQGQHPGPPRGVLCTHEDSIPLIPHDLHTSHSMHSQPGQAARQPPTAVAYAHTSRRVAHTLPTCCKSGGACLQFCHAVAGSTRYKTTNHTPVIVARSTSRQRQQRSVSATTLCLSTAGAGHFLDNNHTMSSLRIPC